LESTPAPTLEAEIVAAQRRDKRKRRLLLALKIIIILAVLWGIHGTLRDGIAQISKEPFTIRWHWLVAAGAIYLVANLSSSWYWRFSMQSLGQSTGMYRALRAYVVGHLGKYAPGKALVVVIRTALVRGPNCDTGIAAACVFLETLTMMACGASFAAIVVAITVRDQLLLAAAAVGLAAITMGPTWPKVFRFVARKLGVGKHDPQIDEKLKGLVLRVVLVGWCAALITWFLYGASLWATLMAIGHANATLADAIIPLTAATALAVVAGFASFIPGGIGVRDLVLVQLLTPLLAAGDAQHAAGPALAAAMMLRLVWLAAEVVAAGVMYPLRPRDER
jgi:uncharacterized membrane protein YbhN (UPF0104 family)